MATKTTKTKTAPKTKTTATATTPSRVRWIPSENEIGGFYNGWQVVEVLETRYWNQDLIEDEGVWSEVDYNASGNYALARLEQNQAAFEHVEQIRRKEEDQAKQRKLYNAWNQSNLAGKSIEWKIPFKKYEETIAIWESLPVVEVTEQFGEILTFKVRLPDGTEGFKVYDPKSSPRISVHCLKNPDQMKEHIKMQMSEYNARQDKYRSKWAKKLANRQRQG